MDLEFAGELNGTLERLIAAASMLQQAADRLVERESMSAVAADDSLNHIVATAETRREADLEQRLASAEAQLAAAEVKFSELRASAQVTATGAGRKTLPVAMVNLLAKQGMSVDSMEAGALDAALGSLSLEQRIAVKSQLMRAGLLG